MYKIKTNSFGEKVFIKEVQNQMLSFLEDTANTDYQAYLKWLAEGNEPSPPDEPNAD